MSIETTNLAGSLVLLKFHYGRRGSVNSIISQTMGKVSVINHAYQSKMPQAGTFWLCQIDKEISNPDRGSGVFIITPIREIEVRDIQKLIPGAYDVEVADKTVVCRPRVKGLLWLMPFSIKKTYIKRDKAKVLYESVVVPLTLSDN